MRPGSWSAPGPLPACRPLATARPLGACGLQSRESWPRPATWKRPSERPARRPGPRAGRCGSATPRPVAPARSSRWADRRGRVSRQPARSRSARAQTSDAISSAIPAALRALLDRAAEQGVATGAEGPSSPAGQSATSEAEGWSVVFDATQGVLWVRPAIGTGQPMGDASRLSLRDFFGEADATAAVSAASGARPSARTSPGRRAGRGLRLGCG